MAHEVKPITIKKSNSNLPLLFNKKIILKKDFLPFKGNVKVIKSISFQKDVLYEGKSGDFLAGDLSEITIVNHLYKANNACRTIAICKSLSGEIHEKTSDEVTKLIGQNNYDNLFASLCSVINQELKIRGIYSLLTIPKPTKVVACQTENCYTTSLIHAPSQTDDSYINIHKKIKMKRRIKRAHLTPYVIPESKSPEAKKPKRLVITPNNFEKILSTPESIDEAPEHEESVLPDLGPCLTDEDSNNSYGRFSSLSVQTTPDILLNPMSILDNVDKVTRKAPKIEQNNVEYKIHDLDKSNVSNYNSSPVSIKEELHKLSSEQRIKVLLQQGLHDYKNCLLRDESGHLPIHVAVLNNDVDLLKRQCLVLKMRGISVDVLAETLTPLRMALYQENVQLTALLLQYNADALIRDAYSRNCFHLAAEMSTDHLHTLVNHYQRNASKSQLRDILGRLISTARDSKLEIKPFTNLPAKRDTEEQLPSQYSEDLYPVVGLLGAEKKKKQILEDEECLWKPEYEKKTDAELSKILLDHINKLFDSHGYTPLMLASKLGRYENVKLLIETSPEAVNTKMPSSGNTALFLAVGSACMDSAERGNKSKVVDHFKRTMEILIENGADHNAPNFAGVSVNELIAEHNIGEISMLIANKLTHRNFWQGKLPANTEKFDAFMVIKDKDGNLIKFDETQKNQKAIKTNKPPKKAIQKTVNKPKKDTSAKIRILKSETLIDQKHKIPIMSPSGAGNTGNKPDIIKNMPKVQNVIINKPFILKGMPSSTTKPEIKVEATDPTTND